MQVQKNMTKIIKSVQLQNFNQTSLEVSKNCIKHISRDVQNGASLLSFTNS